MLPAIALPALEQHLVRVRALRHCRLQRWPGWAYNPLQVNR